MLVLFAVFFLARAWPQIVGPFGDSHDGRNGSTWSLASRAVRDDGLLASHGGSHLADRDETYAHHPPLIIAETAVAESAAGEAPAVSRAAAWIGSLITLALVYVLLRRRGLHPIACAAAIVFAFGSQMFFVYGSMLDTLQTSLPFAAAFLVVWCDRRPGDAKTNWPVVVLGALLTLASWEGALLVTAAATSDAVQRWRRDRRVSVPPPACGLFIGLALTVGWLWWADGSLRPIADQFLVRSGESGVAPRFRDFVQAQQVYLHRTFPVLALIVALPGVVLALRDHRLRRLAAVVVVTTAIYPIAMRDAAFHHDYWNYWLLLTFALAFVALAQAVIDVAARHGRRATVTVVSVLAIGALTAAAVQAQYHSPVAQREEAGRAAGAIARDHGSDVAYLAGDVVVPARWFTYYTRHEDRRLDTTGALRRVARHDASAGVLLKCGSDVAWVGRACARLHVDGGYTLVRARRLVELANRGG
jgi:hypothetical protein